MGKLNGLLVGLGNGSKTQFKPLSLFLIMLIVESRWSGPSSDYDYASHLFANIVRLSMKSIVLCSETKWWQTIIRQKMGF